MKTLKINGHKVKTNIDSRNWSFWDGNDETVPAIYHNSWGGVNVRKANFGESERRLLEQLADSGATRVRFVNVTTRVKGYYETYAFYTRG